MASTKEAPARRSSMCSASLRSSCGRRGRLFPRHAQSERRAAREARAVVAERGPRIEFVTATAGPTERTIKLLGDVRSGATAMLYAKVAGYLKEIQVDKGDKVEAGQILAEIESPELEQQYAAASADLAQQAAQSCAHQGAVFEGQYDPGGAVPGRDRRDGRREQRRRARDDRYPTRPCARRSRAG